MGTSLPVLDELAAVPGVMLTIDDLRIGAEQFGKCVQPLMRCLDMIAEAACPASWPDRMLTCHGIAPPDGLCKGCPM